MKNPPNEFLPGKMEAMRMLCKCVIRLVPPFLVQKQHIPNTFPSIIFPIIIPLLRHNPNPPPRQNPIKPPVSLLHLFYNVLLNCLPREQLIVVETRNIGKKQGFQKKNHELLFEVVKGTKHLFSVNLPGYDLLELHSCISRSFKCSSF